MMALVLPEPSEPIKSQFFAPSFVGRTAFSIRLLSISMAPLWRNTLRSVQLFSA